MHGYSVARPTYHIRANRRPILTTKSQPIVLLSSTPDCTCSIMTVDGRKSFDFDFKIASTATAAQHIRLISVRVAIAPELLTVYPAFPSRLSRCHFPWPLSSWTWSFHSRLGNMPTYLFTVLVSPSDLLQSDPLGILGRQLLGLDNLGLAGHLCRIYSKLQVQRSRSEQGIQSGSLRHHDDRPNGPAKVDRPCHGSHDHVAYLT